MLFYIFLGNRMTKSAVLHLKKIRGAMSLFPIIPSDITYFGTSRTNRIAITYSNK